VIQFFDNDKSGIVYGYPRVHFYHQSDNGPVRSGTIFLHNGKPKPLDEYDQDEMDLIVQRPVRSSDGQVHQPESGMSWLNALHQHHNGTYSFASPVIHSPADEKRFESDIGVVPENDATDAPCPE
jgi:hypothetical protein